MEDAASLCGKKEALQEERQRLQQLIEQEEAAAAAGGGAAGAAKGGAASAAEGQEQQDSLDAFMTGEGPPSRPPCFGTLPDRLLAAAVLNAAQPMISCLRFDPALRRLHAARCRRGGAA